jgi:hypothetical protein
MITNIETAGSKTPQIDEYTKDIPIVYNEDATILVYVTSPPDENSGIGVVEETPVGAGSYHIFKGEKLWDTSETPKEYFFALKYLDGQPGYPAGNRIENNQVIAIHRVGEYNGAGEYGMELHTENSSSFSWVAFVTPNQV